MHKSIIFGLIFSMATVLSGFCADQKIAVVDMEKLFQDYYKTNIADGDLKKQAVIFKDYSDKLNDSLVKLQEEFKEMRDASQNIALSEAERENKRIAAQDKYRQAKEKEAELKQYMTEKQNQLKDKYEAMRTSLLAEIRETIKVHAEQKGYTIVLDASGKTLNNIPLIVYTISGIDLTDIILSDINAPVASKKDVKDTKDTKDAKDIKDDKDKEKQKSDKTQ